MFFPMKNTGLIALQNQSCKLCSLVFKNINTGPVSLMILTWISKYVENKFVVTFDLWSSYHYKIWYMQYLASSQNGHQIYTQF